ncbi:MAG TPA: GTP-binding protein, partial [Lachnospiraceae bacterium]|nr:GTP-binding protein [Lachnospiraceae bacterium]
MTTYIDIVTGFLESGKTTFANELLQSSLLDEFEEIVLLICEEGFTEYEEEKLSALQIRTVRLENREALNDELFSGLEAEYHPDYILVEYNGTWDISDLLGLKIPLEYKFRNVVFVSNAGSFRNQLGNMAAVMQPHILNSDLVVFNRFENMQPQMQKKLAGDIKNINPRTKAVFVGKIETDSILKEHFMSFSNPENTRLNFNMNVKAGIFLTICFALLVLYELSGTYDFVQSVVKVSREELPRV